MSLEDELEACGWMIEIDALTRTINITSLGMLTHCMVVVPKSSNVIAVTCVKRDALSVDGRRLDLLDGGRRIDVSE